MGSLVDVVFDLKIHNYKVSINLLRFPWLDLEVCVNYYNQLSHTENGVV